MLNLLAIGLREEDLSRARMILEKEFPGLVFHVQSESNIESFQLPEEVPSEQDPEQEKPCGDRLHQLEQQLSALHRDQSAIQRVYEYLDDAIFTVDMQTGQMMYVSSSHEKMYGHPVSDFYRDPMLWYKCVLDEDKPLVDAGYSAIYRGESLQHAVRILHTDGKIRWL